MDHVINLIKCKVRVSSYKNEIINAPSKADPDTSRTGPPPPSDLWNFPPFYDYISFCGCASHFHSSFAGRPGEASDTSKVYFFSPFSVLSSNKVIFTRTSCYTLRDIDPRPRWRDGCVEQNIQKHQQNMMFQRRRRLTAIVCVYFDGCHKTSPRISIKIMFMIAIFGFLLRFSPGSLP